MKRNVETIGLLKSMVRLEGRRCLADDNGATAASIGFDAQREKQETENSEPPPPSLLGVLGYARIHLNTP
jgi:hypothetical protein